MRVLAAGGSRARLGVVLGTGLGGLAEEVEHAWSMPAADTGWLVASQATGHAGRLVCGRLGGLPIAMLQGRVHGYEGWPPEVLTRGVELLAALGCRAVLLTNASGGLRPDMRSGELVVLTDHVDLVRRRWDEGAPCTLTPTPLPKGEGASTIAGLNRSGLRPRAVPLYHPALADLAFQAARRAGALTRKGVYALLSGPCYETRAEYRMLRTFGADVVGMSTVPEAVAAHRLGLRVAACSVVTNVVRPDAPTQTDAEDVCRMAGDAVTGVRAILAALVEEERLVA